MITLTFQVEIQVDADCVSQSLIDNTRTDIYALIASEECLEYVSGQDDVEYAVLDVFVQELK